MTTTRQTERSRQTDMKVALSAANAVRRDGFDQMALTRVASDAGYSSGVIYARCDDRSELMVLSWQKSFWPELSEILNAGVTAVVNVNDPMTGTVTITNATSADRGTAAARQGDALAASHALADDDGLGTVTWAWLRDGAVIAGAVLPTYTLTQADVGTRITLRATQTDGGGTTESATSPATGLIENVNDAVSGAVAILNVTSPSRGATTLRRGDTLSAAAALVDPDGVGAPIAYQWFRDGVELVGATGITYTLVAADVDARMSVRATMTDGYGTVESLTSAPSAPVIHLDTPMTGGVTIINTTSASRGTTAAREGDVLTVASTLADADGIGALRYQWLRDGAPISAATAATYAPGNADVGAVISVRVAQTDARGATGTVVSSATAAIAKHPKPKP